MKGTIALPWKKYLIASTIKFDQEKIKKQKQLASLAGISFLLLLIAKITEIELIMIISLIFTVIFFPIGIWAMLAMKTYTTTGLLEFSESNFCLIENGIESPFNWIEIENCHLIYLTDYDGLKLPITKQIKRCFIAFENNGQKKLIDFVLTYHEMAQAMHKLACLLKEKHPEIKIINAFGLKHEIEIKEIRTSHNNG